MAIGASAQVVAQSGAILAGVGIRGAGLPATDLVETFTALHVLEQRVAVLKLEAVRELADGDVARSYGASSLVSWLSGCYRISEPAAKRLVELAKFTEDHRSVAAGLRAGSVNVEQAQVIATAVRALPSPSAAASLAQSALAEADRQLAAALLAGPFGALVLTPKELRIVGEAILHHIAGDAAEQSEREALERREREAHERRGFTMSPQPFGGVKLSGSLTDETAAVVREAIESLSAPRVSQAAGDRPGQQASHAGQAANTGQAADGRSAADTGWAGHDAPTADSGSAGEGRVLDERTPAQRRADALVEVCRLVLRTGELPEHGGDRPQVQVTVPYDVLTGELGAGMLDTGEQLTPATARRMACDAHIIPVVLGSAGQVLDVGRSQRLVGGPLRRALSIRDGGCAFPGCDRRPRWTEGHHIVHWAAGGSTDLGNTVLLCGFHHRTIHHGDWTVRMGGDGLPEFIPPRWIDQQRTPRRNHRITLRHLRASRQGASRLRDGHQRQPVYHLQA